MLLLDVTPLSLGIETMGGVFTRLIDANTTIPTRKSEVFSTASDNQPSVEIHVLQGERQMARDNKTIGRFHLDGIPAAPRGVPQIEVTFDIDANGILNVSAKDKGTGKEQKIRIEASSGLTEQEIQRMRDEAKANEAKDKEERERVDKVNAADSMIFSTEKQLKEYGDKLPSDKKSAIEAALGKLERGPQSPEPRRHRQVHHRTEQRLAGCFAGHLQCPECGGQPGPGCGRQRKRRCRFGRKCLGRQRFGQRRQRNRRGIRGGKITPDIQRRQEEPKKVPLFYCWPACAVIPER